MKHTWFCTDNDCCQYMMETDERWEMIELIWLDTTDEDRKKGLHEYIVVHGWVYKNDISEEDAEFACSTYGYDRESIDEQILAECILEESLLSDEYIIYETDSRKNAEKFIKNYIQIR